MSLRLWEDVVDRYSEVASMTEGTRAIVVTNELRGGSPGILLMDCGDSRGMWKASSPEPTGASGSDGSN